MNPQDHMQWIGDATNGHLRLLDQTKLPTEIAWLKCTTVNDVDAAIKKLSVRGAPAIGIAAAYGCVIGAQSSDSISGLQNAVNVLRQSRPTAVNLFWALDRMQRRCMGVEPDESATADPLAPRERAGVRENVQAEQHPTQTLLAEARTIHDEDRAACRAIGQHALNLLRELTGDRLDLLTHCNAGALATGGIGTATAPMYLAASSGLALRVFADETRPLLQGSRLTAWELALAGIDVSIITDSMAGHIMQNGLIRAVITGADRIAASGDSANKIGTYSLAVLARHHHLPFVMAAPTSTIDLQTPNGDSIPLEQRSPEEITHGFGRATAPANAQVYAPAFDVTPAELITAIVTERGIIQPVNKETILNQFTT